MAKKEEMGEEMEKVLKQMKEVVMKKGDGGGYGSNGALGDGDKEGDKGHEGCRRDKDGDGDNGGEGGRDGYKGGGGRGNIGDE